jgi:hypothetical protein
MVTLVDCDHVRNLHDPGFQRLDRIAGARHEHEQDRVGDPRHLDLALPGPDGLQENQVLPGCVENEHGLEGRLSDAAEMSARPHRADEDLGIQEVIGEADAVAEQGALGEGAGRIDGDHADASAGRADVADERADQARLADTGRAGNPDCVGAARVPIELAHELVGERVRVLDERDRPCERAPVGGADALRQRLECPLAASGHRYARGSEGCGSRGRGRGSTSGGGGG